MKRILLIVAMLLMAAPVLAAVSITATDEGGGVVAVSYTADANVRAFALDINVGGVMTIDDICDFNVGDANGYGIFPGKFRDYIIPIDPCWFDPCYNPVASLSDPDANDTGLGGNYITVELGSLGADLGLIRSGTLFRLKCNCHGGANSTMTIRANATRGGVVLEDGSSVTPTLNGCTVVCALPLCTVPNVVGGLCTAAPGLITGNGLVVGTVKNDYSCSVAAGVVISQNPPASPPQVLCGSAVDYNCSLGTWPVPNVYNKLPADANTDITNAHYVVGTISYDWSAVVAKGKVMAQSPAAGGQYACGSSVNYTISRGPTPWACFDPCGAGFNTQKGQYNLYVAAKWDPNCWCNYDLVNCPGCGFQCHGDADGKATNAPASQRIYSLDLGLVTGNWGRKLLPYPLGANPCADIDHKATNAPASQRVYTLDLARLTSVTVGNWARKGCPTAGATLPRNCPLSDAKNNAAYVKPVACNEPK